MCDFHVYCYEVTNCAVVEIYQIAIGVFLERGLMKQHVDVLKKTINVAMSFVLIAGLLPTPAFAWGGVF